ncbi:N-6 DNA methylase [Micromonospora noduli]|uniref:Site-specific DNA-methyltransferase (Adenine-spe cific) n=1 Tax=Micromonospora noduli TaxID=709876 RepID=A0ABX9DA17_9ACTN|nr:N-6 DNA methylase [Micromonospora noduli]RAO17581.1 Site-specific DNA-methyltransferase (adenine-spe cific) [Micromonospora noduli]RAO24682.1 Site-specific DNA-methyltransferase (adenine-spe cific) [Micromonospora noduli]
MENPTITAAEIARLAGVGRAAVSNWRKRHPDFPAPVGGTTASPEFDLIQVEQWLRTQGKLPELATADRLWRHLAAASDSPAAGLAAVGALLLARQRGSRSASIDAQLTPLLPDVDALADELGPQGAFDELWQRFSAPGPGRPFATPDDLADLMIGLANVGGGSVLDPAAGSGAILRAAVRAGSTSMYGQELDDELARLAGLWLALHDVPGEVSGGDSLRADAFAGRAVDAVVCHPPFGATNWGDEELGHDPRWIVGTTPRTEPELAWVQHALAHVRVGGHAVLLMPPTVASRRAGKRIRGELLRRGHLRAVIALPPGVAAPHGVPLHLWVLRRAATDAPPPARALLIDAAGGDLADTAPRVLATWREFVAAPDGDVEEAGFARAVPVIELLDEEVDLTPARRQPAVVGEASGEHLVRTRERLAAIVGELPALLPQVTATPTEAPASGTLTVAELARTGALQVIGPIRSTPSRAEGGSVAHGQGPLVLTGRDVVAGVDASGHDDGTLLERVPLMAGDVVVPVAARQLISRVITSDGVLLGAHLYLLRPNPAALDPWFMAGQLRNSANDKQTTSLSGSRVDVRRAQIRRLPLDEQRAHGEAFQRLIAFESAVAEVGSLSAELVRLTADGLAAGALHPAGGAK